MGIQSGEIHLLHNLKKIRVHFLSDSRNLNKELKRKPYPMPNINGMLMKLEGFQYATSLDSNMGYYHIWLTEYASNLCIEVLSKVNPIGSMKTWGKPSCTLCTKERSEIVSRSRRRYGNLINACSEIYGACRHNLRFHRFNWNWWSSQGERVSCFSTYSYWKMIRKWKEISI